MSKEVIIEEHYDIITAFFEKHGIKNASPFILISRLFSWDLCLYDEDEDDDDEEFWKDVYGINVRQSDRGKLFLEDENRFRLYPNNDTSGCKRKYEFKNIESLKIKMTTYGIEIISIRYYEDETNFVYDLDIYKITKKIKNETEQ